MFALPIFMPRFKSINFHQNIPKISCFCKKMPNLFVLGAPPPGPQNIALIANFWLRAWCFYCCYVILCKLILRLAGVCGFPKAALSLNKFAYPWLRTSFKPDFTQTLSLFLTQTPKVNQRINKNGKLANKHPLFSRLFC